MAVQLDTSGSRPAPRYGHTAILDTLRHRMLLFGGGGQSSVYDDLWALPLDETMAWEQVPPGANAAPYRSVYNAALDAVNDRIVVFGGFGNGRYNDTWVYPLSGNGTWSPLAVAGTPPPIMAEYSSIHDPMRNRLIVFGGMDDAGQVHMDVWALSLSGTPTWTQLHPSGAAPEPRSGACAVYDPIRDRMVLFGGTDRDGYFGDVWSMNLGDDVAWTQLQPSGAGPSPRTESRAVYDPRRDQVWLFGGGFANGTPDDLWTLTLSGNPAWQLVVPNDGPRPSGRVYHSEILDPVTDRMVVSMGYAAGPLTDTWILQLGGTPTWSLYNNPPEPPPVPAFGQPIDGVPSALTLGQSFTITVLGRNDGGISDDGRIVVSFPSFTSPSDSQWVTSIDFPGYIDSSTPAIRSRPSGNILADSTCQSIVGGYLVVEYGDSNWHGFGIETNYLQLTVQPQALGTFYVDVRVTMHEPGAPSCLAVNGVPNTGLPAIDQQGFQVRRFAVHVTPAPPPAPNFTQVSVPTTLLIGQTLTLSVRVQNDGKTSDDGRIVVGFPSLTDPADGQWVTSAASGDTPGYTEHPAGSPLVGASCQPVVAGYLVTEYGDDNWQGYAQEINDPQLSVQPQAVGTFYVDIRATMHEPGAPLCPVASALPSGGVATVDAQGFWVARFAIQVTAPPPPPPPRFTTPITGIPSALGAGESFTISLSVRNDGVESDDGRIVVSFPTLTHGDDGQWVTGSGGNDTPGYTERPAGSPLVGASCQSMVAGYLVAEYVDGDWQGNGVETNNFALTVQPPAAGTFYVDVRATLHIPGPGCLHVNGVPAGGITTLLDQQGYLVSRFAVEVGSPSATWSQITPPAGGPTPRYSASMVYHPGRDALVLYGGQDAPNRYRTDDWVFPLSTGAAWTELSPGGPLPGWRINQGAILNPIEDHLVIFGGFYEIPRNDLTDLALSPVVWWFPVTQTDPRPSPRFGHSAVYDAKRHRMLVIGGYGDGFYNDVWEYKLPGNGTWTQLQPTGAAMPPRTQQAAVYDPVRDRVLIFGGDGGYGMNDVWEMRLGADAPEWGEIHPAGVLPAGRHDHSMIYDPVRDRLIVFGGVDLGRRMSDVWALSLNGVPTWVQLFSSGAPPGPRDGHAAVYDPIRDRMLVFGGDIGSNQFSNELWALTFDAPTPTQVSFGGADVTPDRVRLSWLINGANGLVADVERNSPGSLQWDLLGSPSLDGDRLAFEDRDVKPGASYAYRLVERAPDPGRVLDEQSVTVPPRAVLALHGASPNPAPDQLWVAFSLPAEGHATLELFDLGGRMIEQQEVGALGPGEHRVALSESRQLAAGLYWVRLTRGDRVLTAKACVVR